MEIKYKLLMVIALLSGIIIEIIFSFVITISAFNSFGHLFSSVNVTVQMNETRIVELLNYSIQK